VAGVIRRPPGSLPSLFALPPLWSALAPLALAGQAIADNSLLVEEAYNQEAGVVQHISTWSRPNGGGAWDYSFTQEWPLGGVTHQLSYTISVVDPAGAEAAGIGDAALNYRYQLVGEGGSIQVAPRGSLLLPTGSRREGRGSGALGVQVNLPLSWEVSPALVTHWNAGATIVGSSTDVNLAASVIWRVRRAVNLLLEALWLDPDGLYLNPGVRWAHDLAGGVQVVPGVAYTVAVGPDAGRDALFLYLSFEHPFGR
jgi:Putative MetA-pathway of phenol degradation